MGADYKKENECFEKDYDKIYAKGAWNKDELSMMKDLKKLMYYNLVIDAMENGGEYPGSEYMDNMGNMSFRRGRNQNNGQFMSRDMSRGYGNMGYGAGGSDGGSGMYYPPYMDMNSYAGGGGGRGSNAGGGRGSGGWENSSGRRYYDSEKEKALHQFHKMMENTDDPDRKSALNFAIHELEGK